MLSRVFKRPKKTIYIDLYYNFIRNLSLVTPARKSDEVLKASFDRVNAKYFYGVMDMPNLIFGKQSTRTLGSYNFHTNTIIISSALKNASERVLDYIMYHELLHKKMKFKAKSVRTLYHSLSFKLKEKEFENADEVEKEIKRLTTRPTWHRFHFWN